MQNLVQRYQGIRNFFRPALQSFEFHDDYLLCRITEQQKSRDLYFHWKNVPSRFHTQDIVDTNVILQRLIFATACFSAMFIALMRDNPGVSAFAAITAGIFIAGALLASPLLRVRATNIPVAGGNITVFRDSLHDQLLDEIFAHRRRYFMALAVIDPTRSVRENLRKIRWLHEIDVLTANEVADIIRDYLPEKIFLRATPYTGAPKHFRQWHPLGRTTFDLREDFIAYEQRIVGLTSRRVHVRYEDLHPMKTAQKKQLLLSLPFLDIFFCSLLILATVDNWLSPGPSDAQGIYFVFMGILLSLTASLRISSLRGFEMAPGILLLADRSWDEDSLLKQLENRRRLALRAQAEPDALLTVDEQVARLKQLKADGVISEQEYHSYVAATSAQYLAHLDRTPAEGRAAPELLLH